MTGDIPDDPPTTLPRGALLGTLLLTGLLTPGCSEAVPKRIRAIENAQLENLPTADAVTARARSSN